MTGSVNGMKTIAELQQEVRSIMEDVSRFEKTIKYKLEEIGIELNNYKAGGYSGKQGNPLK